MFFRFDEVHGVAEQTLFWGARFEHFERLEQLGMGTPRLASTVS
jgi:hypothetical protein